MELIVIESVAFVIVGMIIVTGIILLMKYSGNSKMNLKETKYPMGKCTTCGMIRSWQNKYCICPFKEIKN